MIPGRVLLALLAAALLALVVLFVMPTPRTTVRVGTRTLTSCGPRDGVSVSGYCDVLPVPLDWHDPSAGTIGIRYEWYPAEEPRATGTIVALEGGPGFAATGSGNGYVRLFDPLLTDYNLLMMDERGTGASAPIDCSELQRLVTTNASDERADSVAACADQLDHTFRAPNGSGYVHASGLFATQQSVRDLAAVLRALRLPPVSLFGDSYGTFFAQAFATSHPELVRSVVLDSGYPLDQDFFDAPARDEIRFAYDAVCKRSFACNAAAPGSSVARIRRLARRLAATPLRTRHHRYDAAALGSLLQAGSIDTPPLEYRNLDAAARAWLDRDDAAPLLRLFAWSQSAAALPSSYTVYSAGMEIAAECTIYRPPFDMHAAYPERVRQYRAAVAALPASFFDPVANRDVLGTPDDASDQCLRWPAPVRRDPVVTRSPPLLPASIPVLMISGELDSTTPPADARLARERLGPSASLVVVPNAGHVPSTYDEFDCAQDIVRTFIVRPHARPDTSCFERLPEIRAVGVYPETLADEPPGSPRNGDQASNREARLAALAVATIGDALQTARFLAYNDSGCAEGFCGAGLRGGSVVAAHDVSSVVLSEAAYSTDSAVSGWVSIARPAFSTAVGIVHGQVHIRLDPGTITEDLTVRWDERRPRALATIDGRSSRGHAIHETVPAP